MHRISVSLVSLPTWDMEPSLCAEASKRDHLVEEKLS
jgi:hypothetical protein